MDLSSRPLHDGWTLGGLQLDEHDSGMLRDWGSEFFRSLAPIDWGASALMQGLADGYFVLPYTIPHYLAEVPREPAPPVDHPEFTKAEEEVVSRTKTLLETTESNPLTAFTNAWARSCGTNAKWPQQERAR